MEASSGRLLLCPKNAVCRLLWTLLVAMDVMLPVPRLFFSELF